MFDPITRIYLIISVFLFITIMIIYSIAVSMRIKTYEDYNLAGRKVSVIPLILTIMGTAIGGSTVLGFTASGYLLGLGRSWEILPAYMIVVLLILFMLKPIRSIGTRYGMITIPDYTAMRYGEGARIPSAIAILFAYCAITGMQYTAIATFLFIVADLNFLTGIVFAWLILTLKTYFGGLSAVVKSDSVQSSLQNLGIITLFIVLFVLVGGYRGASELALAAGSPELTNIFNMPVKDLLVFTFTLGGYQIVRQDTWQRIWAAGDMKTVTSGFWLSTVFGLIITASIFSLGTFGRLLGVVVEDPALAFYAISSSVLPVYGLVIVITGLMATIISAADSNLVAGASSVVNDLIKPFLKKKDQYLLIRYSRYAVLIASVISLILAIYIPRLIELWVTGTAMLTSGLLIPILAALFWRRATNAGGITAIWGGLIVAVIWQLLGHPFGLHPVYAGLPVSFVLLVTVSLCTAPATPELVEALLYRNSKS
jgi:Na+/proline symporter